MKPLHTGCSCSEAWKDYDPAPIEVFHGEAMKRFHEVATKTGSEFPVINGIQFNSLLAEFKTKIMKEYGISSDAIPKKRTDP